MLITSHSEDSTEDFQRFLVIVEDVNPRFSETHTFDNERDAEEYYDRVIETNDDTLKSIRIQMIRGEIWEMKKV